VPIGRFCRVVDGLERLAREPEHLEDGSSQLRSTAVVADEGVDDVNYDAAVLVHEQNSAEELGVIKLASANTVDLGDVALDETQDRPEILLGSIGVRVEDDTRRPLLAIVVRADLAVVEGCRGG